MISINELYEYICIQLAAERSTDPAVPTQSPERWFYGLQGSLAIARNPRPRPADVAAEVHARLGSRDARDRAFAVDELFEIALKEGPAEQAARAELARLLDDDSLAVRATAKLALKRLGRLKARKPSDLAKLDGEARPRPANPKEAESIVAARDIPAKVQPNLGASLGAAADRVDTGQVKPIAAELEPVSTADTQAAVEHDEARPRIDGAEREVKPTPPSLVAMSPAPALRTSSDLSRANRNQNPRFGRGLHGKLPPAQRVVVISGAALAIILGIVAAPHVSDRPPRPPKEEACQSSGREDIDCSGAPMVAMAPGNATVVGRRDAATVTRPEAIPAQISPTTGATRTGTSPDRSSSKTSALRSAQPPEARQFVVYFPFDNVDTDPSNAAVLKAAVQYGINVPGARFIVMAYSDSSEDEQAAQYRAKTVADFLVSRGVGEGQLSVDWRSQLEQAPAVDGVREPIHRRATIDVSFRG